MPLYRKKPVVVEAMQLRWSTWNDICDFLGNIISPENPAFYGPASDKCGEVGPEYINIKIPTLEGDHIALHGDYIIKGVNGEFYPCKPDIFEKSYEQVEESNSVLGRSPAVESRETK